ncbi:ABC transporter protein [Mycena chlorophos]|uniref:ABC transporter protein n=1 Tax=Mycena chlorophos TaxID=658473 RepID=A0A8H6VXS7_MYCCL|nr:ABC transporter protein [Mycena chlorophos]
MRVALGSGQTGSTGQLQCGTSPAALVPESNPVPGHPDRVSTNRGFATTLSGVVNLESPDAVAWLQKSNGASGLWRLCKSACALMSRRGNACYCVVPYKHSGHKQAVHLWAPPTMVAMALHESSFPWCFVFHLPFLHALNFLYRHSTRKHTMEQPCSQKPVPKLDQRKAVKAAAAPQQPQTMQLGVWQVHYIEQRWHELRQDIQNALSTVKPLTRDLYTLSPILFPLFCIALFAWHTKTVLTWFVFNRILFWVEAGIKDGKFELGTIAFYLVLRATLTAAYGALQHWVPNAEDVVSSRIIDQFEDMLFKWKAKADTRTLEKNPKVAALSGGDIWTAYRSVVDGCGRFVALVVQVLCARTYFSSRREATLYTLLFLVKPAVDIFWRRASLWRKSWVAVSTDADYNRMSALRRIGTRACLKQENIANGRTEYLAREYRAASQRFHQKDASVSHPDVQYLRKEPLATIVLAELLGEIHLVYFLIAALRNPARFSLSKLVMLEDNGETIFYQCRLLADLVDQLRELGHAKQIYELADVREALPDGMVDHPTDSESVGMGLAMRNVSFSYARNEAEKTDTDPRVVLEDISFSITPGQLVVVVGANGSGKSTLVKLLTRMYDCTSGTVVVDGRDVRNYKKDGLHEVTALLPQDANLYPGLSIAENIGIGDPRPEAVADRRRIREAARLGGAAEFVEQRCAGSEAEEEKQRDGAAYERVVDPIVPKHWGCKCDNSTPVCGLCKIYEPEDEGLSGGQLQRLAASRLFMRLSSGKIKLLIADEPSAALDPEAERNLFESLIRQRQGKTMIFVTHRFGHLTKCADWILCMKDGRLVEMGTHEQLMGKEEGEYATMYNTQATAFD